MEDRTENSHGIAIPKKSRSLDLKSLYNLKVPKKTPKKNLKRQGSSHEDGDRKTNQKKKIRKEMSLNSLENADGNTKKVVDGECCVGPSSDVKDSCELQSGLNQRLSSSNGFYRVSLDFGDNVVHIPKRKRGLVRRKKFGTGRGQNLSGQTSSKSGHGDQMPELIKDDLAHGVESSMFKQDIDEFKENMSSDSNSVQRFKGNEDSSCYAVVNGRDSGKMSRKMDRKRKILAPDSVPMEAGTVTRSSRLSGNLKDDDDENLEENAARMLSSRFDPRCTGFSASGNSSMLPSENGISILLSSGRNVVRCRSKSLPGSDSTSVDAAGRVLRPRKQHKEKGSARKRRHFYEIFLDDLDAYWVLNQRIKVFWPLDQSWYYGIVNDYDKSKKLHHIKYDDRDEEWINLQTERFKLLLLPSEVPGNAGHKRSAMKSSSVQRKGSKSQKERQRKLITEDDNCGESFMDSEPIISWLARSSNRVKSSFTGVKKQRISVTPLKSASSLLYEEPARVEGVPKSSLWGGKSNASSDSVLLDKLGDNFTEKPSSENATCSKDGKMPIVYFRRRFRRLTPMSPHVSEGEPVIIPSPGSVFFDSLVGRLSDVKEPDNKMFDTNGPLCFTYNAGGVSEIGFLDLESTAFKLDTNLPIRSVLNYELESLWLLHAVSLLQYGVVMMKWPRVHLEMLFVDNVVGLRFLLFEGCLKMAAAFVFMILRVFLESAEQGKYVDMQLPVTSIRFRFSGVDNVKRQVVFAFYNFSRLQSSEWMYLDSKLQRYCLLSKRLHISECTYDNIQALQNGLSKLPITTIKGKPSSFKVVPKRTRMGIMGISTDFTPVDAGRSSVYGKRKHPLFALSFAAAPTFFLSLHLKLLMERSVNHLSFCDHSSVDDQENGYSSIDDVSHCNAEISLKKDMMTLSNGVACASRNCQNIGLSAGSISGTPDSEMLSSTQLQEWQSHNSGLELISLPLSSSIDKDKADEVPHSFLGHLNVQIPSLDQIRKPVNGDLHSAHDSPDLCWNVNECATPSPKSTAARSSWHRNRNCSSSSGLPSQGWSGGNADSLHNGFSNGPKKPRTQVSYSLPFAGYDFSSKHRNTNPKGFPHKRIRKANEKKSSDVARGPEKDLDSLSCDANVLITVGDRGWRESGAQVVLELFDHNEWKLSVKFSGITRYSYKAHQFLQPGSTNRYTHAMMWKGGKNWTLEFTDRSQWALFKEMHEECYNRNLRAASVKNIPIPGVRLIEENDNGPEVAFVRGSNYFQQVETDVDMALNPSRVLYDMDSEDEQWISNIQNSEKGNSSLEGISDMFEKIMDMFEKAAYSRQRDQFTPNEIEEIMGDVGPLFLVKTIYEHWQQRRQHKGMTLVRHFQPPLWERYQQEVREWEVAINKNSIPTSYGCLDKVAALEKPPMFAFCLKPRGLEVPNKGSKHRSQKKFSVSGHTNSILGEQDGLHNFGRRMNGFVFSDEKLAYLGHNFDSLDDSPISLTSPRVFSSRDADSMGYFSLSNDGYDRNRVPKLNRSKSKKSGSFIYHDDSQMMACHSQSHSHSHRMSGNRSGVGNRNFSYDWSGHRQYKLDSSYRHGIEQLDASDHDEYKLRDASGAAQHALNVAKLKRQRAQRLLYRADLAIHKAVTALMTAEAMKASEDSNGEGR
ncbi:uncharacterized protein LOC129294799 [Prosopis cineraria]|uniref:uncharacterized protein LOC129294799 n=1 Tax=Prosopis cineraria TaxID=364024 RepID=UPI00240F36FB|nr:uncharacterized protein LOC129294799 [Prosopis cineraria]XP_054789267.1 uncharacterized protein LOC129294799 [Prosopis cineraria]XP_054789268.1 uncharacterized protein LOC129294799 [Prosopis cineraria]